MKLICFLIFFIVSIQKILLSQNLVPNPSFEKHLDCPSKLNQLLFVENWYKVVNSSVDFYHRCAKMNSDVAIPKNIVGFQYPKTDSAYIGLGLYVTTINNAREYVGVELIDTLEKNNTYRVSLFISLANSSQFAISNFGVNFSEIKPTAYCNQNNSVMNCLIPQVVNPINNMLDDTLGWQQFIGKYKAKGGERYITIGNFSLDLDVNSYVFNNNADYSHAAYYIDDVSVIKLPDQDIFLDNIYYPATCFNSDFLQLRFQNQGAKALDFTKDTVIFSTEVKLNGAVVRNFDTELNSNSNNPVPNTPLAPDSFMTVKIGPVDLSSYGSNYQITVSSFSVRDSNSSNDTLVFDMVPGYQEECFNLKIPNVFTPNGDGINDTFYFQNAENKKLHTQILNRWGEEVANWSGNQGWDGAELPSGVYYYLVKEIREDEIKVFKGKLSLLR